MKDVYADSFFRQEKIARLLSTSVPYTHRWLWSTSMKVKVLSITTAEIWYLLTGWNHCNGSFWGSERGIIAEHMLRFVLRNSRWLKILICCPVKANWNRSFPAYIYLFKFNNRNTSKRLEICWKLTIKTSERSQMECFAKIVNML